MNLRNVQHNRSRETGNTLVEVDWSIGSLRLEIWRDRAETEAVTQLSVEAALRGLS